MIVVPTPPLYPSPGHGSANGIIIEDPDLAAAANAIEEAQHAKDALAFAQDDETTGGLTWGFKATSVFARAKSTIGAAGSTATYSVGPGQLNLTANATNYVRFERQRFNTAGESTASPSVTFNTTAFESDATSLSLWEIETGSSSIVRMTDRRAWLPSNGTVTEVGDGEGHGDVTHDGEQVTHDDENVTF